MHNKVVAYEKQFYFFLYPNFKYFIEDKILAVLFREGITELKLEELVEMSQEEFSNRFRGSAIKRAKVAGLRRNAKSLIQIASKKVNEEDYISTDGKI